jgi:hypothetical protein
LFDRLSAVLLISNALFVGVHVEYMFSNSGSPDDVVVYSYMFRAFFLLELGRRMYEFGYSFWCDKHDMA